MLVIVLDDRINYTRLDFIIFAVMIFVINLIDDHVNNNMIVYQ